MKNPITKLLLILALIFLHKVEIKADIVLPAILSDNMVLQQNTNVNIWGKANKNEKITIKTSWSTLKYSTTANSNGKWKLVLSTPEQTNQPQAITIIGNNTIHIKNILIGEIWLCSGQSNMDFPVAKDKGWRTGITNEEEEMRDASFPEIRLFHVAQKLSPEQELDDCEGEWMVCNSENLKEFSAVGYFFGKNLYQELQTPIGLIQSTWGGTHAESWTSMQEMIYDPVYADLVAEFFNSKNNYTTDIKNYELKLEEYNLSLKKGATTLKKPKKPNGIYHNKALSTLWNAMIVPILPFTIKGVIWYQGESNSIRHQDYRYVFTKMINSWRKEWNQGDFPFYFVQIAPHYKQPPHIREAQLETWKSTRNTGMVVITDAADSTDIHPRHKQIPGERLARWALAKTYGKTIPYSGPIYHSHEVIDNKVHVTFNYAENGLVTSDKKTITGFSLAGSDKIFHPATATIEGNRVILFNPQVKVPMAIRYNWNKYFQANFYNQEGLPASPFRTDRWAD